MGQHTYYGFKLRDGISGLKRALTDASISILSISHTDKDAIFEVEIEDLHGYINMTYDTTKNHPLAKLGPISVLVVTVTDNLPDIKPVLTLAFLRGGG